MKHKANKGITLIELIIAMAIFVIVISVVLSLFMTGLKGQRRVITLQNLQDNARFLLGFMAKEIRMSNINNVVNGETLILDITHPISGDIIYTFTGAPDYDIKRRFLDPGPPAQFLEGAINSGEVLITGSFSLSGIGIGDGQQPRVTITVNVETVGVKVEEKAEVTLQTTVSPRNLEI